MLALGLRERCSAARVRRHYFASLITLNNAQNNLFALFCIHVDLLNVTAAPRATRGCFRLPTDGARAHAAPLPLSLLQLILPLPWLAFYFKTAHLDRNLPVSMCDKRLRRCWLQVRGGWIVHWSNFEPLPHGCRVYCGTCCCVIPGFE